MQILSDSLSAISSFVGLGYPTTASLTQRVQRLASRTLQVGLDSVKGGLAGGVTAALAGGDGLAIVAGAGAGALAGAACCDSADKTAIQSLKKAFDEEPIEEGQIVSPRSLSQQSSLSSVNFSVGHIDQEGISTDTQDLANASFQELKDALRSINAIENSPDVKLKINLSGGKGYYIGADGVSKQFNLQEALDDPNVKYYFEELNVYMKEVLKEQAVRKLEKSLEEDGSTVHIDMEVTPPKYIKTLSDGTIEKKNLTKDHLTFIERSAELAAFGCVEETQKGHVILQVPEKTAKLVRKLGKRLKAKREGFLHRTGSSFSNWWNRGIFTKQEDEVVNQKNVIVCREALQEDIQRAKNACTRSASTYLSKQQSNHRKLATLTELANAKSLKELHDLLKRPTDPGPETQYIEEIKEGIIAALDGTPEGVQYNTLSMYIPESGNPNPPEPGHAVSKISALENYINGQKKAVEKDQKDLDEKMNTRGIIDDLERNEVKIRQKESQVREAEEYNRVVELRVAMIELKNARAEKSKLLKQKAFLEILNFTPLIEEVYILCLDEIARLRKSADFDKIPGIFERVYLKIIKEAKSIQPDLGEEDIQEILNVFAVVARSKDSAFLTMDEANQKSEMNFREKGLKQLLSNHGGVMLSYVPTLDAFPKV
jgi:hypothetical protein